MFHLAEYGPAVQSILSEAISQSQLMPLAPRQAVDGPALTAIRAASASDLFDGDSLASEEFAACVRSALLLYFSALDESHTLSQGIKSATGSYLHGIMHRQEPDYPNSRYWFRRVGRHELFPTLLAEAQRLRIIDHKIETELASMKEWNPEWLIDHCERTVQSGDTNAAANDLIAIQNLEWQLVFDYSYRRALSG